MSNFVLLSHRRTGTNLVKLALRQHPDVFFKGEILNQKRDWHHLKIDTSDLIDVVFDCKKTSGFLMHYSQINGQYSDVAEVLMSRDVKVIDLRRFNVLKQYVSHQIAFQTQVFNVPSGSNHVSKIKIIVDVTDMEKFFVNMEDCYKKFTFPKQKTFWYEDLNRDFESTMIDIQKFIDVEPIKLNKEYRKIETRMLSQVIENYREVMSYIALSRWSYLMQMVSYF